MHNKISTFLKLQECLQLKRNQLCYNSTIKMNIMTYNALITDSEVHKETHNYSLKKIIMSL